MDPKEIQKLAKVLRDQGDKLLTSEFKFNVTGELLRALNDSFSLIVDEHELVAPQAFQVTKPNYSKSNVFRDLMFIFDFVQKTLVLRITKFIDDEPNNDCSIDISKFRNLTTLEIQRVPIKQIKGLQSIRMQLTELVAEKCLYNIKELITHCAGDNCSGFMWNNLKRLDLSYNKLERVDNSFEFTPYLQHLNLSHNNIVHISALVWLPNLKVLNLSYNQLTTIPKLNTESIRRLHVINLSDNCIEDVAGIVRLESLLELDLSGNCLLDHALLLPLCTLSSLRYLNMSGNPLAFHPKHRVATCRYLSKNASSVQFYLDGELLSKHENSLTGNYENYYPLFGHRMHVATSSSTRASSNVHTPTTKSISNTPDNSSLNSLNAFAQNSQKKVVKVRNVVIEDREKIHEKKSPVERKLLKEGSKDHLTTKREIEQLREQYGNEWLFNQDAMMGFDEPNNVARRRLELGELLSESPAMRIDESFDKNEPLETSTPQEEKILNKSLNDKSDYKSVKDDDTLTTAENSVYGSALEDTITTETEEDEIVVSEPEDDEIQYIVVDKFTKDDLFLTLSETTIKEKDAMTGRTLTKWGISQIQSVERLRSDLIKLNFDTIRKDKREREYQMELKCCQELEKILRDYLSSRSLSELNQTIYKCPKCNSQFCREFDERMKRNNNGDIRCPSCGNKYVIELQNNSKITASPPKPLSVFLTGTSFSSLTQKPTTSKIIEKKKNSSNDKSEVPKTNHSFSSIESAFDSNQSVAGSSVEILSECSSHISHTSQSSIEVLDPFGSRKPSEERRISNIIDDNLQIKPMLEEGNSENTLVSLMDDKKVMEIEEQPKLLIGNVNLTESSSSGESVQTAYEQNGKRKPEEQQLPKSSPLESIFKTSSMLLLKSNKKETESNHHHPSRPIQYNYDDLSILDHRLKLYCFQHVLEDNDEKIMWLCKCTIVHENLSNSPPLALLLMSTRKIYILKIIAKENEEISSWIQKSSSNFIDCIQEIQELPFQNGFNFVMKNSPDFYVLTRDNLLSEKMTKHIETSNQMLEIKQEPSQNLTSKLMIITKNNPLKYLSMFKLCEISLNSSTEAEEVAVPHKILPCGVMLVTTEAIHLVTNLRWLCNDISNNNLNYEILTQPMTNLVELDNLKDFSFVLNFMDELENTIEKWKFVYDSNVRIKCTLEIIDEIWRKIFSLPLLPEDENADGDADKMISSNIYAS